MLRSVKDVDWAIRYLVVDTRNWEPITIRTTGGPLTGRRAGAHDQGAASSTADHHEMTVNGRCPSRLACA
jgi:hypothetical protein